MDIHDHNKQRMEDIENELNKVKQKLIHTETIAAKYLHELTTIKEQHKHLLAALECSKAIQSIPVIDTNNNSVSDITTTLKEGSILATESSSHQLLAGPGSAEKRNPKKRKLWTQDMDNRLRAAVEANTIDDKVKWKKVLEAMGGELNRRQCLERWNCFLKHCTEPVKTSKFTAEEDEVLRSAVAECDGKGPRGGLDWIKVSELMGKTRSPEQCRLRWSKTLRYMDSGHLTTPFEPHEDELLLKVSEECVRNDGNVDWVAVAKHFNGTRTPVQCCSRRRIISRPRRPATEGELETHEGYVTTVNAATVVTATDTV
eukprot:CAMPEP_0185020676 /NCGR_PEP_ID=MMETSP1103-20130426/3312_1 /TAXON_ID=36769 /ORGANISM="Paraphysomonas bandaiensis, Strain Caron Lab Isolate" /LENGTH=314 /DNA_ID=CAMNT_0027551719 /DNA_START=99 /DNA_END=1043 /DNA_ORIENTATION=-